MFQPSAFHRHFRTTPSVRNRSLCLTSEQHGDCCTCPTADCSTFVTYIEPDANNNNHPKSIPLFNPIAKVQVSHVIPNLTAWTFPSVPVNTPVQVSRPLYKVNRPILLKQPHLWAVHLYRQFLFCL